MGKSNNAGNNYGSKKNNNNSDSSNGNNNNTFYKQIGVNTWRYHVYYNSFKVIFESCRRKRLPQLA